MSHHFPAAAAFSKVIASLESLGEGYRTDPPEEWRQGRTLFGGLLGALALAATYEKLGDVPPLRSAQFAFIGPVSGALELRPALLRAGKSTTLAAVEGLADGSRALRATFMFAAARASSYVYRALPMPDVPMPGGDLPPFFDSALAPRFSQQFEAYRVGDTKPFSGATIPKLALWIRHGDINAPDDFRSLVALADVPPPAALAMFTSGHPISTVTWSFDILCDRISGAGWHLIQVDAESVGDGYSSQRMVLWDTMGTALLVARQTIAIFG